MNQPVSVEVQNLITESSESSEVTLLLTGLTAESHTLRLKLVNGAGENITEITILSMSIELF